MSQAQAQTAGTAAREKRGGLFDDLSVAQVAAGALAAVTSLLLSSQIGIAGSAIGVAVGSVVSTVSSQVYKKFIQRSADRLKDLASSDGAAEPVPQPEHAPESRAVEGLRPDDPFAPRRSPTPEVSSRRQARGKWGAVPATVPAVADASSGRYSAREDERVRRASIEAPRSSATGTRIAGERLRRQSERRKRTKITKGVIAVSVISALVAMLLSAGVVNLVTAGKGLGYKTELFVRNTIENVSNGDASAAVDKAKDAAERALGSAGISTGR